MRVVSEELRSIVSRVGVAGAFQASNCAFATPFDLANNRRPPAEARRRVIQARIFAVVADYLAEPSASRAPPCALSGDALRRRVESWDADADERDLPELHATVMGNPRSTPEDAALVARAAQKLAYVRRRVKVAAQIEALLLPPAPGGDTGGDGGDGGDGGPRAPGS